MNKISALITVVGILAFYNFKIPTSLNVNSENLTQESCRADLKKLGDSINGVLTIGKTAALEEWDSQQIRSAILNSQMSSIKVVDGHLLDIAGQVPSNLIGPCGKKSLIAFNEFTVNFESALGMQNDSDYKNRPNDEKEKLKTYWMEKLKTSRENLELERTALRKLAHGD